MSLFPHVPASDQRSGRRARLGVLPASCVFCAWMILFFAMPARAGDKATGIVSVTCSVPGAVVWIDGQEGGPAPMARVVPIGPHQVRIVADNYDPFVRKVEVAMETTARVECAMIAGKGTVEFAAKPTGARVLVDGQEVGPSPIRIRDISNGSHTWRIEAPGHEPQEGRFEFQQGKNLLVQAELRSSAGLFHIDSDPQGAAVFFDGKSIGNTPVELESVEAGVHNVRVVLDGWAEVFRTIDTSDGSKGDVQARLTRSGARLVVRTGHKDALVLVSGNPVGQGRRVRVDRVETASLPVTVEAVGYKSGTRTVRIPSRGRVVLRASLAAADTEDRADVAVLPPLYRRWTVLTGASVLAVGGGAAGWLIWDLTAPPPLPEGDVTVALP